ncbi:MAG TPA: DUF1279 domain-containing protein [Nannocystaceae bacterium]|nr:DUF1279 domain-containing protein [Nannocystaceae bacterium]
MDDSPPEPASAPAPTTPPAKLGWRERLQEYGAIGVATYLAISVLTFAGFVVAISTGFEVEGVVGESSIWFAAWVGLKLTQPIRVAVVLVVTPVVAAVWNRLRGRAVVPKLPAVTSEVDTRPDP